MARPRFFALLIASLFLATALAGCFEGGDDEPAGVDPAGGSDGTGADGADGSGVDANATPTDTGEGLENESLGHMPHMHDYWAGRERVTIMDDDVEVDTFRGLGMTFFQLFGRQNPGAGGGFATFPDGAIVYEGTGRMEVTVSWQDPLVTGMTMRYRSAESPDFGEPIAVQAGSPIEIDVTPAMTDMPHESTSRWMFLFEPGSGQAVLGAFHVKVDIIKVRDIGEFPGHPELFGGQPSKVLLDADGQTSHKPFYLQFVDFLTGADPAEEPGLVPDVVPMETMEMRIDLTVASASTTTGEANEIFLVYKTADSNRWRGVEPIEADPATGTYVFAIPVEMREVDSPYAAESQWRFDVYAAAPLVEGTGASCGGCFDQQIQFHMTVTAYDHNELLSGDAGGDDDDG